MASVVISHWISLEIHGLVFLFLVESGINYTVVSIRLDFKIIHTKSIDDWLVIVE